MRNDFDVVFSLMVIILVRIGGDNNENVEKAIGNIPGLGLAASNGSCFSPPLKAGDMARTWLALDLGVDWESVKRVRMIPVLMLFFCCVDSQTLMT